VLFVFNGTVLELFDRGPNGSSRFHREFLPGMKVDSGVLTIDNPDKTYNVFSFAPEQRPALEALVTAVAAVRDA
jgi:hypothetical protein